MQTSFIKRALYCFSLSGMYCRSTEPSFFLFFLLFCIDTPVLCVLAAASLCGTAADDTAQLQRRQVLNVWKEIQESVEKIQEKLASAATTAAPGRPIKDVEVLKYTWFTSTPRHQDVYLMTDLNVWTWYSPIFHFFFFASFQTEKYKANSPGLFN